MEVHHHTHTDTAHGGTSRKKFTHYLWEFLMLFLAVFCGFMAENFREHLAEHQREREYMRSLVEDLQTDTSKLNHEISFGEGISDRIEKLVSFLDNNDTMPKDSVEKLYSLNTRAGRVIRVDIEDRTSSQLKNAGNMRLVRNKAVADSIRIYWGTIKELYDISDRLEALRGKATDLQAQLFYSKYVKLSNPHDALNSERSILPGAQLINDDPKLLAEYANRRNNTLVVSHNYINCMNRALAEALNLITLITKAYNL